MVLQVLVFEKGIGRGSLGDETDNHGDLVEYEAFSAPGPPPVEHVPRAECGQAHFGEVKAPDDALHAGDAKSLCDFREDIVELLQRTRMKDRKKEDEGQEGQERQEGRRTLI